MSSSNERRRIGDIIDNIDAAVDHLGELRLEEVSANSLVLDACERCLQRITEAAIKIGETRFGVIAPSMRFDLMRGMGNMLRHEYDVIIPSLVFQTVRRDLPILRDDCQRFLDAESPPE